MGLNNDEKAHIARQNYEINHLDKSSPIIPVSISNYLVDFEDGSFSSYGSIPVTQIGHPLLQTISFFQQNSEQGAPATPPEIIEIK